MPRPAALPLRPLLLLIAVVAFGMRWCWPLLEGRAPGWASGEGAAHIWGLLTTTDGLWEHGPYRRVSGAGHPSGTERDLLDPINLLVFGPVWSLLEDVRLAWAGLGLAWIAAAAAAGWALGRRLAGSVGGMVLGLSWVASPYFHGALLPTGRSEYWPWVLWPLHLALLHGALHETTPRRRLGWAAAAGLTLGAIAHGGWQPLLFLLLGQIPAALLLARGAPRPAPVLVGVALLGAVLCLPMLAAHLELEPWWLSRLARLSDGVSAGEPLVVPAHSLLGTGGVLGGDTAPFGGRVLPVLALVAAVRHRPARPWALLGLGLLVLSLGPRTSVGGVTLVGPSVLLPGSDALHGWARVSGLAPLPFAIASTALFSDTSSPGRLGRLGPWLLGGVLLLEGLVWQGRNEQPGIPTSMPRSLAQLLVPVPDGPLAVYWSTTTPRETERDLLLLQLSLDHRVSTVGPSPQQARPLSPFSVLEQALLRQSPLTHPCAAEEAARLWAAGFRGALLLHGTETAPGRRRRKERELTTLLGPPAASTPLGGSWALKVQPAPTGCGPRIDGTGAI